MKRLLPSLLIATGLLTLASCKNAGMQSGLAVPKDAAFVFHVNSSSLSSKLSWNEIKNAEWFKDLQKEAAGDTVAERLLANPEASGIDLKSDFVYFIRKRGRGGYGMLEGSVNDAAAFETTIKASARGKAVTKDGDWSVLSPSNKTVVLWNKSKFVVANDVPMPSGNPMMGSTGETVPFEKDSLQLFAKQVMNLDGDEMISDDDRFADVMKEPGDMHVWVNANTFMGDMMGMMSMMKASTLLEGNAAGFAVNFDNGKITVNTKQFYNKELAKMMEGLKGSDIGAALLNRIPQGNVIGLFAMNFNPQGMKEYIKALGFDGMVNSFLGRMNLTLDELLSATKGDVVMSVSDLVMKDTTVSYPTGNGEEMYSYTRSEPDVNVMMAVSVNQKPAFDKLINNLRIQTDSADVNLPVKYDVNNDWFVASNKPATVSSFMSGATTKHPFTDKLTGHSTVFYLDLQRILKTPFSKDSMSNAMQAEAAAVWKDVVATGTKYGKNQASGQMVINFMDEKTNSLKQLNAFVEKMAAANKRARQSRMDGDLDRYSDSATTVPPVAPLPADEAPVDGRNN